MLSVAIGALIFMASALFGLSIKRTYRERYEIFLYAKEFCEFYELEIKSKLTTLPEIIDAYVSANKNAFCKILKFEKCNNYFSNFSEKEIQNIIKNSLLTSADNGLIAEFLSTIGKNSFSIEITNIERFIRIFDEKSAKYLENLNKNGVMYYKLFIVLGIALMLIIV